jgi:D-tyrosyl-tRNA(Tyr) deacylase
LLQRVSRARVRVDGETCGAIEGGLLVLAGVAADDNADDAAWLSDRIAALRIFPDAGGKMNLPVGEAGAAILLVSQFTLHADASRGRRPSFARAARPEQTVPLLDALQRGLEERGLTVPTGRFGKPRPMTLRPRPQYGISWMNRGEASRIIVSLASEVALRLASPLPTNNLPGSVY